MAFYELRNATVGYDGRPVLDNVSLSIEEGERVALVGESGAGKSTLLTLLHRQQPERTALIPQDPGLVKTLSVFHNIYMGRLHLGGAWYNLLNLIRPLKREVERVRPIARQLRLEDKLFAPAGELSGGQQQRTSVARALHQEASAILGDEPVSAVDEHQARHVLGALTSDHMTVVLAMHDVDLALAYTDRIIGLGEGQIILDQPTSRLKRSDLDPLYNASQ